MVMRIAVCVKQVPDSGEVRLNSGDNTLTRGAVGARLNPLDEYPLEAALTLKDARGAEITCFSMGPTKCAAVLDRATAMGVDRTVILSDAAFAGSDTWATAIVLAKAIQTIGSFDLILCGKQAVDGDTAQVGPGIAARLDIAQICQVSSLTAEVANDGWSFIATREFEEGKQSLRVPAPVLMTVSKGGWEPRCGCLENRLRALNNPPLKLDAAALRLPIGSVGLKGSPTRVVETVRVEHRRERRIINFDDAACVAEMAAEIKKHVS